MKSKKLRNKIFTVLVAVMICGTITSTNTVNAASNNSMGKQKVYTQSKTSTTKKGKATIDGVSVRSKNSASGKFLGSLYTGDKVEIVQKTNNGWYKIKYKKGYAYVSTTFIKLDGSSTTSNAVLNTGSTKSSLVVRKTASSKSSKLGTLSKGAKVEIVDVDSNNWYKIKYKKSYGYVSGNSINLTKGGSSSNNGIVHNTSTLNVRKTASTKSSKIGTLKKGQKVQVVKKQSNGWYKIKFGSKYGYVSNKYIKTTTSTSSRKNLDNFLFVGDSFTYGIRNVIKSNNNNVYIHAQGGSRPSYWLDKVGQMPSNNSVEGISFLLGVNGVKYSTNINDAKLLLNKLTVRYPDKTIYVQKVFPVGTNYKENKPSVHNKHINEYNRQMEAFCKTKSNLKFVNSTGGFVSGSGYLKHTDDGLHIKGSKSSTYYKNIFNAIKKAESK